MNEPLITHHFDPIIPKHATVMILGSFPSVTSRGEDFYYMHPQNRFWPLLSRLCGTDFNTPDIPAKKRLLHAHGIALYDVIARCRIVASADNTISDATPADIPSMIVGTDIKTILLNGRTAEKLFREAWPSLSAYAAYVPSTSPANARYGLDELTAAWKDVWPSSV